MYISIKISHKNHELKAHGDQQTNCKIRGTSFRIANNLSPT